MAVIVFPSGFGEVKLHVFFGIMMVAAIPSAFEQRPKPFNRVGVDIPQRVANGMAHDFVFHANGVNVVELPGFIRHQASPFFVQPSGHQVPNVGAQRRPRRVFDLGFDLATPFHRANHRCFVGIFVSGRTIFGMFVRFAGFAADKGFVGLHNPSQEFLAAHLPHCQSHPHLQIPCRGLVHIQITGELPAGKAFLGIEDESNGQKPFLQRDAGALKNGAGKDIETALASMAIPTANAVFLFLFGDIKAVAEGALGFAVPADGLQIVKAGLLVGKAFKDFD